MDANILTPDQTSGNTRTGSPIIIGNKHRVEFFFDDASHDLLVRLTSRLGLENSGATIREALRLLNALVKQRDNGFKEVIVENPDNCEQRTLVVDSLKRLDSGRN